MTVQTLLESLPRRGSRPAAGVRGEYGIYWRTYEDLYRDACRVAHAFACRGLAPGSRILLWAANSPEWLACFLGAALRGLVTVPADAGTPPSELAGLYERTGAAVLVFGQGQEHRSVALPKLDLTTLVQGEAPDVAALRVPVGSDDPAVVLLTSGTGGEPRPVMLTHGNLMCQVDAAPFWKPVAKIWPVRQIVLSPLSHVQGLVLGGCVPLSLGFQVVYTPSIAPGRLLYAIRSSRINVLSTVPRVLQLLADALVAERDAAGLTLELRLAQTRSRWRRKLALFRSVRSALGPAFGMITVGGATLPASCEAFWRDAGCLLVQGYGSTETAAFITVNRPFSGALGSVGRAVHDDSLRIAGDGEILVRGPQVAQEAAGIDAEGYLHTGDLGRRDAQGRIFFLGRKQDLIVTAEGHNVHPDSVEAALQDCAGVGGAVVVGQAAGGLEEVHAVLLLKPGADPAGAVREANARLDAARQIRSWSVWPDADFPRGALQKVRRNEVARRLSEDCSAPAATPNGDSAPASLQDCLGEPVRHRRIGKLALYLARVAQTPQSEVPALADRLGLDSLDTAQLLLGMHQAEAAPPRSGPTARAVGETADWRSRLLEERRPPGWQHWPGAQMVRVVCRSLFCDPWLAWRRPVQVRGVENLAGLHAPLIFALARSDRIGPFDFVTLYRALPRRLARRVVFVIGTQVLFHAYLHRDAGASRWYRRWVAFLFHIGVPMIFPFTLFPCDTPASTLRGLARICFWIDRGYHPIAVWGKGAAMAAAEVRAAVVPVRLRAAAKGLRVSFGAPVQMLPDWQAANLEAVVATRLRRNE